MTSSGIGIAVPPAASTSRATADRPFSPRAINATRGPNDAYTVLVGVVTVGLAVLIAVRLVRRRRRLGLE